MANVYQPVGICIYCGAKGKNGSLSDEHIIPYSLGGEDILPKSSCQNCADITSKIERYCARNLFGQARVKLNIKTRRPKERPLTFPIYFEIEGEGTKVIEIPTSVHISPIYLPFFAPPGILSRQPVSIVRPPFCIVAWFAQNAESAESLCLFPTGAKNFSLGRKEFDVFTFERLLAKIAHGVAVATFGLYAFKPFLRDIILGKNINYPYFIGSFSGYYPPKKTLYEYGSAPFYMTEKTLLVVRLRLFANLGESGVSDIGSPEYLIVVGRFTVPIVDDQHVVFSYDSLDTLAKKFLLPVSKPIPDNLFGGV